MLPPEQEAKPLIGPASNSEGAAVVAVRLCVSFPTHNIESRAAAFGHPPTPHHTHNPFDCLFCFPLPSHWLNLFISFVFW